MKKIKTFYGFTVSNRQHLKDIPFEFLSINIFYYNMAFRDLIQWYFTLYEVFIYKYSYCEEIYSLLLYVKRYNLSSINIKQTQFMNMDQPLHSSVALSAAT